MYKDLSDSIIGSSKTQEAGWKPINKVMEE